MFKWKRTLPLTRMLKKHPNEMYVTDKIIAILLPNGRMLAIVGDHQGITQAEANLKLQNVLRQMQ